MSTLWTPSGEHSVGKEGSPPLARGRRPKAAAPPAGPPGDPGDDQLEADAAGGQVDAMRAQLAQTPADVVIANHCYGLFELAAIYLSQQPPMLFQAKLAIDGLGFLLNGLKDRLGEAEPALFESLSQLQLAFVQLEGVERTSAEQGASSTT